MSPWDENDLRREFLAAMERDLAPLLEESSASLDLDDGQTEEMDDFLTQAWVAGIRCGRDQMDARVTRQPKAAIREATMSRFAAEFKPLMDKSAAALNLTVPSTISMWSQLHEAWMAGNRTCEAELIALYVELESDVGEEALKWLEERDSADD